MLDKIITFAFLFLIATAAAIQPLQGEDYSKLSYNQAYDAQPPGSCTRTWFETDYLYWKIKDSPEPIPLVIEQEKRVLGAQKIDTKWRSGARLTLGYWFDRSRRLGIEVNYFFLSESTQKYSVGSNENGSPSLRVPYFNVITERMDSSALATPGLYKGLASLKLNNKMQGSELNIWAVLPSEDDSTQVNVLGGFRYWNFDEHLKFSAYSPLISPPSIYNYYDKFHVRNNFYGAQMGAALEYNYCSLSLNLEMKVALGKMYQQALVDGRFVTSEFTSTPETFVGGFFALPTNSGHHKKTRFAALPEVEVTMGYQITDYLRFQIGYSILYVSHVLFAGEQIDPNINPTQSANIDFTPTPVLEGKASPKDHLRSEGLWAQGLKAGFEFKF